jgi:hypothetical protein
MYPLMSTTMASWIDDARNELDVAVRFVWVWVTIALFSFGLLLPTHSTWLVVSLIAVLLAQLSYRGAVIAAGAYGTALARAIPIRRSEADASAASGRSFDRAAHEPPGRRAPQTARSDRGAAALPSSRHPGRERRHEGQRRERRRFEVVGRRPQHTTGSHGEELEFPQLCRRKRRWAANARLQRTCSPTRQHGLRPRSSLPPMLAGGPVIVAVKAN